MVKALVPVADGFEELELISIVDILRRANINVTLASVTHNKQVKGAHQIVVSADALFDEVKDQEYDLVVCAGGMDNAKTLGSNQGVIARFKRQKESGKLYAAICASPKLVLEANGLLEGVQATGYPGLDLHDRSMENHNVVVSHNCVTSKAPGTALEFSLKLVEVLCGAEKAAHVAKDACFKHPTQAH